MKKLFAFFVLSVLMCMLGNRAMAQETSYQKVSEIDFTGFNTDWRLCDSNNNNVTWQSDPVVDPNTGQTIQYGENVKKLTWLQGTYMIKDITGDNTRKLSFSVDDTQNVQWSIAPQEVNGQQTGIKYFQRTSEPSSNTDFRGIYIRDLKAGDKVVVYPEPDKECLVGSDNTDIGRWSGFSTTTEFIMQSDGALNIVLRVQYAGIHKIELWVPEEEDPIEQRDPIFNYDPGYEVYDFFEVRDVIGNSSYGTNNADFNLNGSSAQYFSFYNNDLSLNKRFVISQPSQSGDTWRFVRGLVVPSGDSNGYFSICDLREGDRVQIFWTGDAPTFASQSDGSYNGCSAYYDTWNDGVFDSENDGDHEITPESSVEYIESLTRNEGTIADEEGNNPTNLYTSAIYVVTEDGHMDFRLNNTNPLTRIVMVRIYSDHQATMVDEYDQEEKTYNAHFDITGELQAKEHIVPGGLEVHVGNNEPDQHAIVVSSKEGPVSYVNAVDGFKLPGITKKTRTNDQNEEEEYIEIEFDLKNNIPETGTFYKFMPLEEGDMTLRFETKSMNYYRYDIPGNAIYYDDGDTFVNINGETENHRAWDVSFNRPNEQTLNVECPYYLVEVTSENEINVLEDDLIINGGDGTYNIEDVKVGSIYYLYGGWCNDANTEYHSIFARDGHQAVYERDHGKYACGVAELFDVEFTPKRKIHPLAKWVKSGTTADNDLAIVSNYETADLLVKKMSGNITDCTPYIETDDDGVTRLKIKDITFAVDEDDPTKTKNPGGTILIKVGDPGNRYDPVYAYTVAYSADPKYDKENIDGSRGHTWDFSTNSLQSLEWEPSGTVEGGKGPKAVYDKNGAQPIDYGTYYVNYYGNDLRENDGQNGTSKSLLYEEMHYFDNKGIERSDWLINDRLQINGQTYDRRFLSKYDMEGDNADMLWDTEGMILLTSSNQSCIFNEFKGSINRDGSSLENDPNRYIGILEGGSFLIPKLYKDDRVIIWMGSGEGSGTEHIRFSIENAYDAVHNLINPDDEYRVGGSQWNGSSDPNYRGCYHFFATGDQTQEGEPADMIFNMVGGSVCKIYKIQIYSGDRIFTNEINGDNFYQVSKQGSTNVQKNTWDLKYFGKREQLANGTGNNEENNEVIAYTGQFTKNGSPVAPVLENNKESETSDKVVSFSYTNSVGDAGTIRVRAKDMEQNMNYVADFAERNITIAYQETMPYPYTWDFTDIHVAEWSGNDVANEWIDNVVAQNNLQGDSHYNLALWDANGKMRVNSQTSDPDSRNNIFEANCEENANQLWANGKIIPETQGLLFYMGSDNANVTSNDPAYNGSMQITSEGLRLANTKDTKNDTRSASWNYKMIVPNVPAGGAVYLRMKRDTNVSDNSDFFKKGVKSFNATAISDITDGTSCRYFEAGNGTDEYIVAIPNTGSAAKNLTFSLNGWILEKVAVSLDEKSIGSTGYATESRTRVIDHRLTEFFTDIPIKAYYGQLSDDETQVTLQEIEFSQKAVNEGDAKGYILHNESENGGAVNFITLNKNGTNKNVFHLFVPDLHDTNDGSDVDNNIMLAHLDDSRIENGEGVTRYVLTNKWYSPTDDPNATHEDDNLNSIITQVRFVKVDHNTGAKLAANSAYMELSNGAASKIANIVLSFDEIEELIGVATGIVTLDSDSDKNVVWYTLSGMRIDTPVKEGLYIRNGKKVVVRMK